MSNHVSRKDVDAFAESDNGRIPYTRGHKSLRVRIRDLEDFAKQYDLQGAVVVAVERDGTVTVVSWAKTRDKCAALGEWAQGLWTRGISLIPFATAFGWGNGGKAQTAVEAVARRDKELAKTRKRKGQLPTLYPPGGVT